MFQRTFDRHAQFNSVEINDSRTEATVWWHGARTTELEAALNPDLSVAVSVKFTPFSPSELQAAVDRVFEDRKLAVVFASIRPDGTGIDVSTSESKVSSATQRAIETIAGLPVAVKSEDVVTYNNRQFDTYFIGGSKWSGWNAAQSAQIGYCSSGFAVYSVNADRHGLTTAAHCGPVGSQWGPEKDRTTHIAGSLITRDESHDMAILDIHAGPTYAYLYTGAYDSGTITEVNGARNVAVNTELCLSGSYTGLVCGSYIKSKNATWRTSETELVKNGMYTENTQIAAGQGDSGGPGYALTNENGVLKRFAVGAISAGPSTQNSGCPGYQSNRICGGDVFLGEVWRYLASTPWEIKSLGN